MVSVAVRLTRPGWPIFIQQSAVHLLWLSFALCLYPAVGQAEQNLYTCLPNAEGDGWICETGDATQLPGSNSEAKADSSADSGSGPLPETASRTAADYSVQRGLADTAYASETADRAETKADETTGESGQASVEQLAVEMDEQVGNSEMATDGEAGEVETGESEEEETEAIAIEEEEIMEEEDIEEEVEAGGQEQEKEQGGGDPRIEPGFAVHAGVNQWSAPMVQTIPDTAVGPAWGCGIGSSDYPATPERAPDSSGNTALPMDATRPGRTLPDDEVKDGDHSAGQAHQPLVPGGTAFSAQSSVQVSSTASAPMAISADRVDAPRVSVAAFAQDYTGTPRLRANDPSQPLDWVPREAMTDPQLQALQDNCCGSYIDPMARITDSAENPAQTGIRFMTEAGISQLSENLISIRGEVVVQQGPASASNDQLTRIDRETGTVLMEGNVVVRERGLLLTGNSAAIDNERGRNQLATARYVLHDLDASGRADSIEYNSETGLVSIDNGEYSRCEPQDPFWTIRASSIVLDRELNRGYAKNASLHLGKVPVFYFPFTLPFPIGDGRISGFLPPSIGSTRTGGVDFQQPYYLNLAPHYDATLSPRLVTDRGAMLGAEFRYLASWSMNSLNFTYLADDDLYDPEASEIFGSGSPAVADRWFIGFQHQGALGRHFTSFVDYNEASDQDYFLDLDGVGLNTVSRTHLNQQGRLDFHSEFLQAGINLQRIQVMDPFISADDINKPFDRLPQLHFDTGTDLPGGFRLDLHGEITSFDRQLNATRLSINQIQHGALVKGERINLVPALAWSVENPGWFLRARASHQHISYALENQAAGTEGNPQVGVAVFSLDSGLVFERPLGNGASQTLEPRLFYLNSEYEDQSNLPLFDTSELNFSFNQLFREDRFSGGDRVTDADQLTLALSSRIFDSSGSEQARVSFGQIRYFADRQVSLGNPLQQWMPRYSLLSERSALAFEMSLSVVDNWRLNTDLQWDDDRRELIEGSFQLRYQRDRSHLLNLAYRYRNLVNSPFFVAPAGIDPRISQTDISGIWPLSANWKLLGRWNYDHSNSRNLESFAGVEWSNCCTTIRLVGREWVDDAALFVPGIKANQGVFFQLILKGLGDLAGGGLSNLLQDGIRGFRETDWQ